MSPRLMELAAMVVAQARHAGLDLQDQLDAAEAALMAAMPDEAPAIAHIMVEQMRPRLAVAA